MEELFSYGNEITLIYGTAATGKTTLAMLAAIRLAREKKKTLYLDSEGGFSPERFIQLAGKDASLLDCHSEQGEKP